MRRIDAQSGTKKTNDEKDGSSQHRRHIADAADVSNVGVRGPTALVDLLWNADIVISFDGRHRGHMEWQSVSADFVSDGSLRDIYIRKATLVDWQAVIDAIKNKVPALDFRVGNEAANLPCDISKLFFRGPSDLTPSLYVPMGDATVNCHFVSHDEVAFDLNPRDMNAELLPLLLDFLTLLGKATNKPVLLTMENARDAEIMRYEPSSGEIVYLGRAFG